MKGNNVDVFLIALLMCVQHIVVISRSIPGIQNSENELSCRNKDDYITNRKCVEV